MPKRSRLIIWLAATLTTSLALAPTLPAAEVEIESLVAGASESVIESLEPASLQRLASEVIARNPGLAAAERRAASIEARIPQVRALPDPMASLTPFLQSPETRVGPQQVSVAVSQRIPWFGKLDLREQAAMWAASGARADVEARKLALVEETSRLYYELAFLDRWKEIVGSDRSALTHYEELARTRYSAGIGTSQAPIKLQAEITKDQTRLVEIDRRRASTLAAINALRDAADGAEVGELSIPSLGELPVRPDAWLERALASRPELARAQADIERASTGIDLAHKDYMPDVTFGLSYTLVGNRTDPSGIAMPPPDNGQDVIALTAGINLPIWRGRLSAGVTEAELGRESAEQAKRATVASIRRQLDDLAQRLPLTATQVELFENVLVRQAEQSLLSAEAGYASGNLGALDLLDAQRVLLEARTAAARARTDYAIAAVRLATTTASPLDGPVNTKMEGNEND